MGARRRVLLVAAATALAGLVAVVQGGRWTAALAGLGAVVVAVLAAVPVRAPNGDEPAGGGPVGDGAEDQGSSPGGATAAPPDAAEPDAMTRAPLRPHHAPPRILDEPMLAVALLGRMAMARRALRPLSIVHVEVAVVGAPPGSAPAAGLVEDLLDSTFRESDVCGRRSDGIYVFVLEDTGEDGAVWTSERLRRALAGVVDGLRFCAGIASYPTHGLDAETVEAKAAQALVAARDWRRDRIEVAAGP